MVVADEFGGRKSKDRLQVRCEEEDLVVSITN